MRRRCRPRAGRPRSRSDAERRLAIKGKTNEGVDRHRPRRGAGGARGRPDRTSERMIVYGAHAAFEALRAGRATRLSLVGRPGACAEPPYRPIWSPRRSGPACRSTPSPRSRHRGLSSGRPHQGVIAEVQAPEGWTPADLVAAARAPALLVVLDGIEDPHNLGAILRTADAAGVDGVIRQARRAAPLDGAVGKTSAGAVAHLKIATVVNVTRAIEAIKEAGVSRPSAWPRTAPNPTIGSNPTSHRPRRRCRGHRAPAPRPGGLRSRCRHPDGRPGIEPERLSSGGHRAVEAVRQRGR